MKYDTAKLRQFINDKFGPQDLNDLLFDYFRSVHEDVTPGMTKRQQISLLLEFCNQHNQMPNLLAAVAQMRPFFQPDDYVQGKKAPTTTPQPPAPITRNPRQIFISHAHQDAEVAQRLAHDLEAHGYDIWIVPDSIRPGEKWVEAINRGLEGSGIFVLLLSPDAVTSRWVTIETNAVIRLFMTNELPFIPIILQECLLPPLLGAFQHISMLSGYQLGLEQLLQVLNSGKEANSLIKFGQGTFTHEGPDRKLQRSLLNADVRVHPKTGKEMIRIPAGEFLYGARKEKFYLPEYWIDKTPVTNAEYARFVKETGHMPPTHWKNGKQPLARIAKHPVVNAFWEDIDAYAHWAGCELPSEPQWEKAARGVDGRMYPWGNEWIGGYCNTIEAGEGGTTAVGSYSPQGDSPYGCVDMAGNVWEWTRVRVLRGGSWNDSQSGALSSFPYGRMPYNRLNSLGWRLVCRSPSQ